MEVKSANAEVKTGVAGPISTGKLPLSRKANAKVKPPLSLKVRVNKIPLAPRPAPCILSNGVQAKEETPYWVYFPRYFADITYEAISKEVIAHCGKYFNTLYGKKMEAKRLSCVVGEAHYGELPQVAWEASPLVAQIRDMVETAIMPSFQIGDHPTEKVDAAIAYVLNHLYRDGTDYLGFHKDGEAPYRAVISVTFAPPGVTRKFRFRPIGIKSGYTKEFRLGHGDLLIMKAGCQRAFKHSVPIEKTIKDPRINLTFRYNDPHGRKNPTKSTQEGGGLLKHAFQSHSTSLPTP